MHPYLGALMGLSIFFVSLFSLKDSVSRFNIGPWLRRATGSPWRAALIGFAVTAVTQSSSATNAVTVGLVAAGVIQLRHAFAIVLGANVGTTVTGQLIALNAYALSLPSLAAGLLLQASKSESIRRLGSTVASVGGLFYGLWAMGNALLTISDQDFLHVAFAMSARSDPLSLFSGFVLTALVQSSSAVTGLLIGLADAGILSVRSAVAATLGSNVGTVTTTILASVTGGTAARSVAMMDFFFNLLGAVIALPLLNFALTWIPVLSTQPGRQVAHAHTLFNVVTVLLILPFVDRLCGMVERLRPPK